MQSTAQDMDKIRRAFDEACDELAIEPQGLTLSKRDQLVKSVLIRLDEMNAAPASSGPGSILPVAVRVA